MKIPVLAIRIIAVLFLAFVLVHFMLNHEKRSVFNELAQGAKNLALHREWTALGDTNEKMSVIVPWAFLAFALVSGAVYLLRKISFAQLMTTVCAVLLGYGILILVFWKGFAVLSIYDVVNSPIYCASMSLCLALLAWVIEKRRKKQKQ